MQGIGKTYLLIAPVVLVSFSLRAQNASKCFPPGPGPEFTVEITGVNARDVLSANISVELVGASAPDQKFFTTGIHGSSEAGMAGALRIRTTIQPATASGEYELKTITLNTRQGFGVSYSAPADFTAPPRFRVCNPAKFEKPKIKSVTGTP